MRPSRLILLLLLCATACRPSGTRTGHVAIEHQTEYATVAASIDSTRIRQSIVHLAGFGSRMTGYPGADAAAQYLMDQFTTIGLEEVKKEEFTASVPLDEGGELTILDGQKEVWKYGSVGVWEGKPAPPYLHTPIPPYISSSIPSYSHTPTRSRPLYSVWPNLIRTSTLPANGLTGRLYYVGKGDWADFNGMDVADQIVLMDFNTSTNWENAAILGARAVIFAEPDWTTRVEGEEKYFQVPINFPRFWLRKQDARPLIERLHHGETFHVRAQARMTWKRVPAYNILGKITGTHPQLKDDVIVLQGYYDSISPVPAIAPGANQATGIVALLEMARYFRAHPPARTVYFLATSGHFLSLSGVSAFATRHTRKTPYFAERLKEPIDMKMFVGLDLSSTRSQIGVSYAGIMFAGAAFEKQRFFTPFGKKFVSHADRITQALGYPSDMMMNVISPSGGFQFSEFFPAGSIGLDAELLFWTGFPALSFATVFDSRDLVDTPLDVVETVNLDNVVRQTTFLTALMEEAFNDPDLFPDFKMQLDDRFVTGRVRVVEFNPKKSYIPNVPKPGAIVRFRRYNKSISGVKNEIFVVADSNGVAECEELEAGRTYPTEGYVLDPETGDIIYAPDRGPYGEGSYPLKLTMDWVEKSKPTVVFRCAATNIYDLVDPRFLTRLTEANLLDESGNTPFSYGMTFQEGSWTSGNTYEEDTAALFMPPGSKFKVTMSTGLIGRRLVLTNASADAPEGKGFPAGQWAIPYTPYQVARDMWYLDEARMQALKRAGINSARLEEFHHEAQRLLDRAEAGRQALQWDVFIKNARAAWGYESRAYPDATDTANDVMKGVLFYMALVIPFAYALERLLFGFVDIRRRIAATFGIFLVAYLVLRLSHPAFRISQTPDIVLLAFITLALAVIVIWVISSRFGQTMQQMKQAGSKIHATDVQRSSALVTAFALGIANMRKRKARTLLTCLTLILLMFTVLSFTSVQTYLRIQKVEKNVTPIYTGFLVRNPNWATLQKQTYHYVAAEFGSSEPEDRGITIVPRSWYSSSAPGIPTYIKIEKTVAGGRGSIKTGEPRMRVWSDSAIRNPQSAIAKGSAEEFSTYARAMLGLMPEERDVTGVDRTLIAGRWFEPGERLVCLLPTDMADLLHIRRSDVGTVTIRIFGRPFTVIGLFDPLAFDRLHDLDGEPLTPVDFDATSRDLQTQLARASYDRGLADVARFRHQPAANMLIVPQGYVNDLGGALRSVALRFPPGANARARLERFVPRLGITVVGNVEGTVAVYSALALSSLSGLGNLFIPILVAACIILNTMLNAVYERFKEIGIYSAVGLAPAHIGVLFMAEACVYAVIGGMSGYLIGQTVAQAITRAHLLQGLTLNYSSLAAVASTALVMCVVLLSAVYPARKAAQMAVPDVKRQWEFPEPEGNVWRFDFPFTVPQPEVLGLCAFLHGYFRSYGDDSIGLFRTDQVTLRELPANGRPDYQIDLRAWLAPYDLGVSETLSIRALPTGDFDAYGIELTIVHLSGDLDSWSRVNRRFLNVLRKQFLIWRTVAESVKQEYAAEGRKAVNTIER